MCKKLTVAYGDYIGNRLVGWCMFNQKDYSFLSDKQVKTRIQQGDLVNGLKLDEDNNVVIDKEFAQSLMGKSGLSFSPIMAADDESDEPVMNKYYALVKVVKAKAGTEYHFITNRCGYEVFTEQQLQAMLEVLTMGGIRRVNGELIPHAAVEVVEIKEPQNKAKGSAKETGETMV